MGLEGHVTLYEYVVLMKENVKLKEENEDSKTDLNTANKRIEELEVIRDRLRVIKKAARTFVYCNDEADALFLNGFGNLKKALEVSDG